MAALGVPALPSTFRELVGATSTAEECRQWLVQYGLLAGPFNSVGWTDAVQLWVTLHLRGKLGSEFQT